MSGEYIQSVISAVQHGHKSVYGATQDIANYIEREIQAAKEEGYAEGKASVDVCDPSSCEYYCNREVCDDRE